MSHAATETMLSAGLAPAEGVESILVRHMARASHFTDDCFERAGKAEVPEHRAVWLRLATRLSSLLIRALDALQRHREQARKAAMAAYRDKSQARFDHVLHLAAIADKAAARKMTGGMAAGAPAVAPASGEAGERPLSRQQRRAAERQARKAEKRLRSAAKAAQGP